MTDRREFLQYAMASAVPLAAGVSLEARASSRHTDAGVTPAIRHVVIDSRHDESRAFAASFATDRVVVHPLADGDATDFWLRTLAPAWREAPVAVAGLTRPPALFILEQLAWSHGLRVVYHAEHVVTASGTTGHQVLRVPADDLTVAQLERFDSSWPDRVAELVARYVPSPGASRPGPTPAGLLPSLPQGGELLTSWIIAPV